MKLEPRSAFTGPAAQGADDNALVAFVIAHHVRLWRAARLLGGCQSSRLVDRCADLLEREKCLGRRTRLMLGQILSILSLDMVDNPDLPYATHFAEIDLEDPVIDEICWLTDGLRDALGRANREDSPATRRAST